MVKVRRESAVRDAELSDSNKIMALWKRYVFRPRIRDMTPSTMGSI